MRVLSRGIGPEDSDAEWVRGDLRSGSGLEAATVGVDAVVHAATDPRDPVSVDVKGTAHLSKACRGSGVTHFVYVSIVGVDRIPLPYYGHKLDAERIVERGAVPHSILRVTQFHGFIDFLLREACRVPLLLPIPAGVRIQSIDVGEVAEHLCEVVQAPPGGRLPYLVGPETLSASAVARAWVRARKLRRMVLPLPFPGAVMKALRRGHNLDFSRSGGGRTWAEWMAARYGREAAGRSARALGG